MDQVTVTSGEATQRLQAVYDQLPTFFRGFADLLEYLRVDK
jgi:hypothetical protein